MTSQRKILKGWMLGGAFALSVAAPFHAPVADAAEGEATTSTSQYITPGGVEGDSLLLPVGSVHGATVGSIYSLYPATGEANDQNRLAQVKLVRVDANTSRAQLTDEYKGKVALDALRAARARETAHSFETPPLKLFADGVQLSAERLAVWGMVTSRDVTRANADVILRREANPARLVLENREGLVLARVAEDAEADGKLGEVLQSQSRLKTIAQLRNADANAKIKIEMRVVPVNVTTDAAGIVTGVTGDHTNVTTEGGRMILREGDHVMVDLKNASGQDVFVTLLDLSPDGTVAALYPENLSETAPINRVPADGQWHRVPMPYVFAIGKPFGNETFKALATTQPVNFQPLLQVGRTFDERGAPNSALGRLLLSASTGKRDPAPQPTDDWATAEVTFVIKPRQ